MLNLIASPLITTITKILTNPKVILALIVSVTLVAGVWYVHNAGYKSGVAETTAEFRESMDEAIRKRDENFAQMVADYEAELELQKRLHDTEIGLQTEEAYQLAKQEYKANAGAQDIKEKIRYVQLECTDGNGVGDDAYGLLIDARNIVADPRTAKNRQKTTVNF